MKEPAGSRSLPEGYAQFAVFDARANPLNRRVSHILHFAAAVFFTPLFAGVLTVVRPGWKLDPVQLWSASIPGLGALGSAAVLFFVVVAALNLRTVVRAGAFRLFAGVRPTFTPLRLGYVARAEGHYLRRNAQALVTATPFFVLSLLGVASLAVVPETAIAWVFLPLVANAVASARDVLLLSWLLATPRGARVTVSRGTLTAFARRAAHSETQAETTQAETTQAETTQERSPDGL